MEEYKPKWYITFLVIILTAFLLLEWEKGTIRNRIGILWNDFNFTIKNERFSITTNTKTPAKLNVSLIVLLGVKKCGTVALRTMLRYHPDVIYIEPTIHSCVNIAGVSAFVRFDIEVNNVKVDNKTYFLPDNHCLYINDGIRNIKSTFLNVKFLLALRDPVARTYTNYWNMAKHNQGLIAGSYKYMVDAALEKIQKAKKEKNATAFSNYLYEINYTENNISFMSRGLYKENLNTFKDDLDPKELLIVLTKDIINKPGLIMKNVQEFFGLSPVMGRNTFRRNKDTGFYCVYLNDEMLCLPENKSDTQGTPKPLNTTVQKLEQFFKPYNEDLFDYLGYRLNW